MSSQNLFHLSLHMITVLSGVATEGLPLEVVDGLIDAKPTVLADRPLIVKAGPYRASPSMSRTRRNAIDICRKKIMLK